MLSGHYRTSLLALTMLAVAAGASAQQKTLGVDWSDPEITAYVRERTTNPPRSLTPGDEAKLSKLKLPVLAFDRPPATVERAFGVAALPARKREIVTDDANPVWYHIVDSYADITITVDADLRVQQALPDTTRVYASPERAGTDPQVSILDENVEAGMEGLIATYTVVKFGNIPYRITVECSRERQQFCKDPASLLRDRDVLRIISARPQ
jgi:hypothetical protein